MTRDSAKQISDRELSQRVAVELMGYERVRNATWFRKDGRDITDVPRYASEIVAAMQVLNHLRPQFEDSSCGFYQLRDDEGELIPKWEASALFERDIFIPNARVQFDEPSEALSALARSICLAALSATKDSGS